MSTTFTLTCKKDGGQKCPVNVAFGSKGEIAEYVVFAARSRRLKASASIILRDHFKLTVDEAAETIRRLRGDRETIVKGPVDLTLDKLLGIPRIT